MRGLDASSTSRVARVGGCKVVCRPSKNNLLEASVGKSYLVVGYRFAPSKERVPVPWTHAAYVPTGLIGQSRWAKTNVACFTRAIRFEAF